MLLTAAWVDCAGTPPVADWVGRACLKEEWPVANGPDIYMTVAELFDKAETLGGRVFPDEHRLDLPWVWRSNPEADKRAFTLTWPKGTRVVDMMREIAQRRGERMDTSGEWLRITPGSGPPMPEDCRQKSTGASAALDELMEMPLVRPIIFDRTDGDGMEEFLNFQLQRAHARQQVKEVPLNAAEAAAQAAAPGGATLFRVRMSAVAKQRAELVSLLGWWTSEGLLNKIAGCAGLLWRVEGDTVVLESAEEGARRETRPAMNDTSGD